MEFKQINSCFKIENLYWVILKNCHQMLNTLMLEKEHFFD
jgi:hypothetical protein